MTLVYTKSIKKDLNNYLKNKNYSKIFVLVDENTLKHCLKLLGLDIQYQIIKITSGENNKNIKTINYIWQELLLNNADRNSLLINLGGGIISDLGGFAASTYKRGINYINIPTTTLAMVDATVGGKTGFNFDNKKNMIGLFSQAQKIFVDVNFIKTLSKREYLSGIAEALKHGLLFDIKYFDEIVKFILQGGNFLTIVKKSIEFKKKIVEQDFKENGIRKILNLGHSIGHALESYFLNKNMDIKHGEAVIMGLIAMLYLSNKKFNFDISLQNRIIFDLKKIYTFNIYKEFSNKEIINYIVHDKKNNNDTILMVLLKNINKPIFDIEITIDEINETLDYLKFIL